MKATEDERKSVSSSGKNRLQVLIFSVGGETLALPLSALDQILSSPRLTPLPRAQAPVCGVVNASGRPVLTVSLAQLLALPSSGRAAEQWLIVCTGASGPPTGFWVDEVHQHAWIDLDRMQPTPSESRLLPFAKGVWRDQDLAFCLLDENQLEEKASQQIASFVASLRSEGEELS